MDDFAGKTPVRSLLTIWLAGLLVACTLTDTVPDRGLARETLQVRLPAGTAAVEIYRPDANQPRPMVIIVHGFARSRKNMTGWGQHLAAEGFLAVVPDLPTRSDHARNGQFLYELRQHLLAEEDWQRHIDPARVGLMGFSAGGLSTLLSAARTPEVTIWVGLDPVDRAGLGASASSRFHGQATVITAEPSICNAYGNVDGIIAALPNQKHIHVENAVHVDAEWPGSWDGEFACGRSSAEGRAEFRLMATRALKAAFKLPISE